MSESNVPSPADYQQHVYEQKATRGRQHESVRSTMGESRPPLVPIPPPDMYEPQLTGDQSIGQAGQSISEAVRSTTSDNGPPI